MPGADSRVETILGEAFGEQRPAISPDGRGIAYQSDESGRFEIYLRPFPNTDDDKRQVSREGGVHPLWSPDGRELFFLGPNDDPDNLFSVAVDTEPTLSVGTPDVVFATQGYVFNDSRNYDVSSDGRRFLMLKPAPGTGDQNEATPRITVVLNWFDELKRLVPIP